MEERKEDVLQAEESILRLGKETERMSATNKLLEGVTESVSKAQAEVIEARKDIVRYSESSAAMNKRTEELVISLNSRYEALETRLRGIDLEITTLRKDVEGVDAAVLQAAKNVQEIKECQEETNDKNKLSFTLLLIVLVISVIGVVLSVL
jgi:hypothetical protein